MFSLFSSRNCGNRPLSRSLSGLQTWTPDRSVEKSQEVSRSLNSLAAKFSLLEVWRDKKKNVVATQTEGLFLQDTARLRAPIFPRDRPFASSGSSSCANEENSLLGWALSPSPLDSALVPPSKAHLTEARFVQMRDPMRRLRASNFPN